MGKSITLATSAGSYSSERVMLLRTWVVVVSVTLLAALESSPGWPWAPFIVLHAVLGVAIPLIARCGPRENFFEIWRRYAGLIRFGILGGAAYITVIVFSVMIGLSLTGHMNDPQWNVIAAYRKIYSVVSPGIGEPFSVLLCFFFVVLWAGIGEELFYRGYAYGRLRRWHGIIGANLLSSVLFGVRHVAQLFYLGSPFPVISGLVYFAFSSVAGSMLAYLYERSGSLWLPIIVHSSINLIGFPMLMIALRS